VMGAPRRGPAAPRERSRLYAADPFVTITGPANAVATPDGKGSQHSDPPPGCGCRTHVRRGARTRASG
jgi:hypothetical protein